MGVLPIRDLKTVALFGVNSYDFLSGGLGSGAVNVPYSVDMVTGLKNIGITTTPQLTEIYQNYIKYACAKLKADKNPIMWFLDTGKPKFDEIDITERCVQHEVKEADAAIITIGRQAGEGMDRAIEGEFNLTQTERDMIFRVSDTFRPTGKPVIVILNSGSVMETASWRDRVDAILCAWQPGEEGGNSVADVLTGKANPSGKLTMTWPIACFVLCCDRLLRRFVAKVYLILHHLFLGFLCHTTTLALQKQRHKRVELLYVGTDAG